MNVKHIILSFLLIGGMISCQNDDDGLVVVWQGSYTYDVVRSMSSFGEDKQALFNQTDISEDEFSIRMYQNVIISRALWIRLLIYQFLEEDG